MAAMTSLCNKIMDEEQTPEDWGNIELIPLLKKGVVSDPSIYRGTTLINTMVKLFTGIIAEGMCKWAEENKLH